MEASPESKIIMPLSWADSIWFSDVDDTLIDTEGASAHGSLQMRHVLARHYGDTKSEEIQSNFNADFQLMMNGYRVHDEDDWQKIEGGKDAFDKLLRDVASHQEQVQSEYGHIKKWSREIFVKRAADNAGVTITPELVHEAVDAYWLALTEKAHIFPDALKLAQTIFSHKRPLYLVTSSDARLIMHPDGQFVYDPAYSEGLKRQRIELLREKGLPFNLISIGDPEDKPHLDFFTKALHIAEADFGPIDASKAIMLGDSFAGDLQTPKEKLGFGLVVLREKNRKQSTADDERQLTVGDLGQVRAYLN